MSTKIHTPRSDWYAGRQRANQHSFRALFPPREQTQATPQATPQIGAPGSPSGWIEAQPSDALAENLQRQEAAWSAITAWLTLSTQREVSVPPLDTALDILLDTNTQLHKSLPLDDWYVREVEQYFRDSVETALRRIWTVPSSAEESLNQSVALLMTSQAYVLAPITKWRDFCSQGSASGERNHPRLECFNHLESIAQSTFHRLVRRTIPERAYTGALAFVLLGLLKSITAPVANATSDRYSSGLLAVLHDLGFSTDLAQLSLAHAVHAAIECHVNSAEMRVDWIGGQGRAGELRAWVEQSLQPSVLTCLRAITGDKELDIPTSDVDKWQRLALGILGQSRLDHLLSYVQLWPQSIGAILDLKDYLVLSDAKQHLAQTFILQMEDRIGHAGVTTAELLGIYVAVIRVFKTLDNRSVLLEKVAQPLRSFLRDRLDTVKVIAASFLAEIKEGSSGQKLAGDGDECCVEIAREVVKSEHGTAQPSQSLDWNDMAWLPDPIDAGPDYRSSKSNDVISYMLTLFDKETFIQEIQNILGERLLRSESIDLENEVRLVEMLKSRLGTDKLQSAEVMVRDMTESARIMRLIRSANTKIPQASKVFEAIPRNGIDFSSLVAQLGVTVPSNPQLKALFAEAFTCAAVAGPPGKSHLFFRNPAFAPGPPPPSLDRFEAKILSSFFWPELRDDTFAVPEDILKAQGQYEAGFKRIKTHRKLRWLSALGRADVELELRDRTVKVEAVKTWVAALIYAFQEPAADSEDMQVDDKVIRKSVSQLEEQLNMDEVLVRNGTSFWVGQRVLQEVDTDVFEVLETLPKEGEQGAPPVVPVPQEESVSALKSQSAVLKDNKVMYEMFMIGMLTNGGAMDASRIAMMLKMVVPGGFNFGEEEVTWLLQGMETDGRVEKKGDAWAVKK